jgi:chromosome partitioning protein
VSDDSLVARGRAIFESLRQPDRPAEDATDESAALPDDVTAPGVPARDADDETPDDRDDSAAREGVGIRPEPVGETAAPVAPATYEPGPIPAPDLPVVPGPTPPRETVEAPAPAPTAVPERASDHFARPTPRVMAVANQKGGVGKTTTAVNLGAALAELGYRVLVIDLDPQGNATTGLGVNPRNLEHSVYDVIMHDTPIEDCIEPTSLRNLFVVPSTIDLAGAEIELVPTFNREQKLRRAIDRLEGEFDFTLIDCPPSLGLITINGLAAATEVIVPIQCEYYALEGLGQLLRNVNLVQGNLNPTLEVSAIVLTMYDARTKLADQVASEVRKHFGDKVCRAIVPRTVRLSEAPSFGQPIIVFDPSSRGALAYRELAKEVSGGAPQRAG